MSNPRVYLDVSINEDPPERMIIELFADVMPRTAENFRAICVGSVSATGKFLHYKGRVFSRIHKGLYARGGVSENQDDTCDESIYGRSFPEEDSELKDSGPGILMMASSGRNEVGSQFLLTFHRLHWLHGHAVFGKVIKGMDTVLNIEQAGTFGRVRITGCGEISDGKVSNVMESDKPQSSSGVSNDNEGELTSKKPSSNPNQHSYDSSSVDDGKAKRQHVVKDKRNPPSSLVRKEEPEAKLQKDDESNKYESSCEKLEATRLPVTKGNDREVKPSANPIQHSGEEISNPRVYLDVSINEGIPERMIIELFADVVPRTAENFRAICVGSVSATGKFLHYKGRVFSTINKGLFALNQDDTGDESIYGRSFPEENCELKDSGPGILMMANSGRNAVGSRFFLTFRRVLCLYGHVVFGKVIKGMDTVQNIEQAGRFGRVRITGCGEISDGKVSNMMESDKPQSSSVRKEEPEPKLQKDNYPNKYESSFEKLEATCLPATKGKDREVKPSANPNQLSGDPGEEMSNPRVYLDVSINEGPPERMVIELFADVEPRIAENFRAICVGSVSATGKFLHYKGRVFSTIFKGFYAQGGVSENQDDTGDESIYGRSFPDEDCEMKYSGPGILMMASNRPNVIGSRFILTFRYKRCVFGRVFGKVIKGMETVQNIEQAGRFGRVRITGCGEIADGKVSNVMEPQSSTGVSNDNLNQH